MCPTPTMQLQGPSWPVQLGRRDARTASQNTANTQLPPPTANLSALVTIFASKGLDARDMTALSGSHTIGLAQCFTFRNRIYNETTIDPKFAAARRASCPAAGGNSNLASLDDQSSNSFDNSYYKNLMTRRGLLHSDQELFNGGSQDSLVKQYSEKPGVFAGDFAAAMVKMGRISPLTGSKGEIRLNCRVPN